MPTLENINYQSLYCLFKGEPGTRKSTSALSFPKPIYFVDWDRKIDALGFPVKTWNLNPKEIVYDSYTDWDSVKYKLENFQINCPYKTVVIDSITSGADAAVRQTIKSKDGGGKKVGTVPVAGFDEFNAEASALSELVALTKELNKNRGVNIILIAHVMQKEYTVNKETHFARVLVTAGKMIAQKIPAYCSEVYHFNIKQGAIVGRGGQYALKTTHTGDDFARTSLPLDDEIIFGNEPLYDKWIKPAIEKMTQPITSEPTPYIIKQ